MRTIVSRRLPLGALVSSLLLALTFPLHGKAAEGYFSGFQELPMMPGLVEDVAAGVVFDKPEGRIVEVVARGKMTSAEVAAYYAGALPQLGWQAAGGHRFRREGEVLQIRFGTASGRLTVRFSLSPD